MNGLAVISYATVIKSLSNLLIGNIWQNWLGLYSVKDGSEMAILSGHTGGVTHTAFSNDGNYIYTGARKDNRILCWDLRHLDSVLKTYKRSAKTNQRIYFDINRQDNTLSSGSSDGSIMSWTNDDREFKHDKAHNDCVNGVSYNPVLPAILISSSGQRKFPVPCDIKENDNESSGSDVDSELRVETGENSLKLWRQLKHDVGRCLIPYSTDWRVTAGAPICPASCKLTTILQP
ncbi:hypothetical protein GJ496_010870 [Pomphorhynchus laevis]|nr:hypothetical protein GJ496_010870 [Pomphorhynchus laevis]